MGWGWFRGFSVDAVSCARSLAAGQRDSCIEVARAQCQIYRLRHIRAMQRAGDRREGPLLCMVSCALTLSVSAVAARACCSVMRAPGLVVDGPGRNASWA
eukprot:5237382-Pyramimonas_sp.AAC.1